MKLFTANNSNDMAFHVYDSLAREGIVDMSRNGRVIMFPEPVILKYKHPWHRANFTEGRDANPFFHIAEAMWMLAGRRDVAFLDMFNSKIKQYSDDGTSFNAAYGHRARHAFGIDQLQAVVEVLKKAPGTRQAIVQLWHPSDLTSTTKDKACNMSMVFSVAEGKLNLTVFNRSNDAIYGNVTGANPVHFSYFQQWVADTAGYRMGNMYFVSNNLHVYLDLYEHWNKVKGQPVKESEEAIYFPLGELREIEDLCYDIMGKKTIHARYVSKHLEYVVKPMMNAWIARKYLKESPYPHLSDVACPALKKACMNWLEIRR